MAKKECKQNMNMAGETDQVEKMSFDELTSVTGGAVGSENAEDARPVNSRGAMVAKYGQLTKLLQQDNVVEKSHDEFNDRADDSDLTPFPFLVFGKFLIREGNGILIFPRVSDLFLFHSGLPFRRRPAPWFRPLFYTGMRGR